MCSFEHNLDTHINIHTNTPHDERDVHRCLAANSLHFTSYSTGSTVARGSKIHVNFDQSTGKGRRPSDTARRGHMPVAASRQPASAAAEQRQL